MSNARLRTLVVASSNPGKLREIEALLADVPVRLALPGEFEAPPGVVENADTYLGNALIKAIAWARWTGNVALADDSGLEVDALHGRPGVHSARYAGANQDSTANIAKVLTEMSGVAVDQRTARFRCVVVVASPSGKTLSAEGSCAGRITEIADDGSEGFGYDPIFVPDGMEISFARLPSAVKNQISHRARALQALRPLLVHFLEGLDAPELR